MFSFFFYLSHLKLRSELLDRNPKTERKAKKITICVNEEFENIHQRHVCASIFFTERIMERWNGVI